MFCHFRRVGRKRFAFLRSTLETRLYKSMRFSALEKARPDRPHKMRRKRRSSQPSQRYPSQQKSPNNPVIEPNTSIANEMQRNEEDAALQITDQHMDKGKQLMQYSRNPVLSLFDLASSDYGAVALDPANLLTAMGDDAYAGSSSAHNDSVPGCSSSKEPDLLVEDFGGPQEVSPSVLGPVNNLIDEAKESEALGV